MEADKYIRVQTWATCIVATFTVVLAGVGIQQCYILRESDRPSLAVAFNGDKQFFPQVGEKLKDELILINSGRSATMVYIRSTIIYSLDKMDAPPLSEAETRVLAWSGANSIANVEGPSEITEGQIKDMQAGRGYIYVRADVRYGRSNQYHTTICTEWKLKAASDKQIPSKRGTTGLCKDPKSNSTN